MRRQVTDKTAILAHMEQTAKTLMRLCIGKCTDEHGKVQIEQLAKAACDELHDEYRSQCYCWASEVAAEYQKTQITPKVASIYNLDIEYKTITTVYSPKLNQDTSQTDRYLTFSMKNQWLEVDVNGISLAVDEATKLHEHYVMVNVGDNIAVRVYEYDNTAKPHETLTGTVTATELALSAPQEISLAYSTKNDVIREHKRPTWA
jgi:hypothetical protein